MVIVSLFKLVTGDERRRIFKHKICLSLMLAPIVSVTLCTRGGDRDFEVLDGYLRYEFRD